MNHNKTNLAFIDGQNLHLGTRAGGWTIDFVKLREYLTSTLNVSEAYYFLGVIDTEEQELYTMLQKAGFIVIFREHFASMTGDKKGNVDTDLIFEVMKSMIDRQDRDQVVLVSGDGDYIKLVKYLIKHKRLAKILFPNTHHSSLYNQIDDQYIEDLSDKSIKSTIRLGGSSKSKQSTTTSTPEITEDSSKTITGDSKSNTSASPSTKPKSRRRRSYRKPSSNTTS